MNDISITSKEIHEANDQTSETCGISPMAHVWQVFCQTLAFHPDHSKRTGYAPTAHSPSLTTGPTVTKFVGSSMSYSFGPIGEEYVGPLYDRLQPQSQKMQLPCALLPSPPHGGKWQKTEVVQQTWALASSVVVT